MIIPAISDSELEHSLAEAPKKQPHEQRGTRQTMEQIRRPGLTQEASSGKRPRRRAAPRRLPARLGPRNRHPCQSLYPYQPLYLCLCLRRARGRGEPR